MKKSHTLGAIAVLSATLLLSHGNVTPQPVDTKGLAPIGKAWLDANPYVGNAKAIEIGNHAYAENCARCHGLDAVSGGVAPDLRYLDGGTEGDQWFMERIRGGAVRNGNVYMPKFEGIMNQEGMWAIRSYLHSVRVQY
ncbi:MAG: cytochrome c-550 PedF [Sulfuricurvum sp.]|nr:cytochrome c-550 PedF [Sulfuricurvum sp.]MDP3587598.1 cytochrome c-550 PedF [Sulfuricurvum sp.]